MALELITESEADANSYGFRKFRSTADAIDALHRWLRVETVYHNGYWKVTLRVVLIILIMNGFSTMCRLTGWY